MTYLTQHSNECPLFGLKIAEETNTHRKYLSAISGAPVRSGVLDSSPGTRGGFRMARSSKERRRSEGLTHSEAIFACRRPGPFGQEACSDDDPGAGRDEWKQVGRELFVFA